MRTGPAAAAAVVVAAAAAERIWRLVSFVVAWVASQLSSRHHLADRHGRTATRCSPHSGRLDGLFVCLVSETPQSVALTTR